MPIMVFDIETIPNALVGKQAFPKLAHLSDKSVIEAMTTLHKQEQSINGTSFPSGFLPHYMHQIVAISVLVRTPDSLKVWSLGDSNSTEKELLERFFNGIDKYAPTLVSWNGTGFDLPVLNYRALHHEVSCTKYWDTGTFDSNYKWNNYQNRYHSRHIDVMDSLSMHQPRANAPLNSIAQLLGFPGKMGCSGSSVLNMFMNNDVKSIRDYCETDVINTYLIFLAFQRIRNHNLELTLEEEHAHLRTYLKNENKDHFIKYLEYWNKK